MFYTLDNQTIVATDTAQRLNGSGGTRSPAAYVLVQANDNNNGNLYVGGSNPTSASTKQSSLCSASSGIGIKIIPGATVALPQLTIPTPYDLHEIWISGTQDDVFSVSYVVR